MNSFLKKITRLENFSDDEKFENELEMNLDSIEDDEVLFDIPIDVYQDEKNIFLRSFIPGIKPEDIDIVLTRDVIELSGERMQEEKIDLENYHQKELVWGRFSKKVLLPNEIDVDKVKPKFWNGLLILKMPKMNKDRSVKVSLN